MSSRRLLVIALTVALVFTVGWLWRAADADATGYRRVPAASTALIGNLAVRLSSLRFSTSVNGSYGQRVLPVPGAVLVLARVDYDATAEVGGGYCQVLLVAGDATWEPEFGFSPPEPDDSTCEPGSRGTMTVLFEVPDSFRGRIEGVAVAAGDEDGATLLEGRPL